MFLNIFKHLLPNARAWKITTNKQLRQFFEGLSGIGSDSKTFFDNVWLDIFPATTRQIDEWEDQFGLSKNVIDEQERRDRLVSTWRALGGQDPRYIQDTLQAAGFNVFVHEWWVPGTEPAVNVQSAATVRDPFDYLNDGLQPIEYVSQDGGVDMMDGDLLAIDGATVQLTGYVLVNKILIASEILFGDGSAIMVDGGVEAQDGAKLTTYNFKQYAIPNDPTKYAYFLYIGAETFPDHANVSQSRKNEFETLCLKICPNQQWLGILVDYS